MYYQIDGTNLTEINYHEIDTEKISVGYITLEEFTDIYEEMGFEMDTYEQCTMKTSTFQNPPLIHSNYSFGLLHILDIEHVLNPHDKFAFYLMKHLFLVIDLYSSNNKVYLAFQTMIDRIGDFSTLSLPQLFSCFLTNLIYKDYQALEILGLSLESLEKKVMLPDMGNIRSELFHYRRALLILRNYYEQFINIAEDITDNMNCLFETKQLVPIHLFRSKVRRLCEHTKDLSEYVSQIKESYMAQLDINLNSIMKVFTIVTTIFMPLTLIAGWYGMNFRYMPELRWKYGYPCVILLSITVLLFNLFWFKKKHFF